jgi:hypothetical protein
VRTVRPRRSAGYVAGGPPRELQPPRVPGRSCKIFILRSKKKYNHVIYNTK